MLIHWFCNKHDLLKWKFDILFTCSQVLVAFHCSLEKQHVQYGLQGSA